MEAELVEKISRVTEFSEDMANILTAINRDIYRAGWNPYIQKLASVLLNNVSHPKITSMKKTASVIINVNNQSKSLEEYCLDLILQILLKIIKSKPGTVRYVTEIILDTLEVSITNNQECLKILYKLMFFNEKIVNYIQENDGLGFLIELYEKIITQVTKDYENSERNHFLNDSLKHYFYENGDFQQNLSRHLQAVESNKSEYNTNVFDDEENQRNTPINDPAQYENYLAVQGNNPNSEQSSFYTPTSVNQSKSLKIPVLNLPSSFNENMNTISRSTRRAEPYKSFTTNSHRLSNYGIGSSSIDYGVKENTFHKNTNENNVSVLENENSYFFDGDHFKVGSYQTGQERMKQLANQLGEYCLTIDLGCLLAQKRKNQLDKVAKISVFDNVESIIDLKPEERTLKDKFKKLKVVRKTKFPKRKDLLGPLTSEIKEVESSENSNYEGSPEREAQDKKYSSSAQNQGAELERQKRKQELKKLWLSSTILANILYLVLKDIKQETLQQHGSLINLLYMSISTDISKRSRGKDKMKSLLHIEDGNDNFDFEFNKNDEISEGIENIDKIHKHFEKVLLDKFKNKHGPSGTPSHHSLNARDAQQVSFGKSLSINDKTKKVQGGKSITFHDSQNFKNVESNQYSNTYENNYTNSSAMTGHDDSIDSIDELSNNQELLSLEYIMIPESQIYYKIFDLYSVLSERINEVLSIKYSNNFELDNFTGSVQTSRKTTGKFYDAIQSEPHNFRLNLRGTYNEQLNEKTMKTLKKKANLFLFKFEKKINWILNNLDMNSPYFYDIEIQQMEILENYLRENTSKVIILEILDVVFESLLLVKKQISDLCSTFINSQQTAISTRITSPHMTMKPQRGGSISKDISAPQSSTSIANNILKAVLKPHTGSRSNALDLSPEKKFEEKSRLAFPSSAQFSSSFVFRQKGLFTSYLAVLGELISRSPKLEIFHLLNDIFVSNDSWNEVIKLFTTSIFTEIIGICDKVGEANDVNLEKEHLEYFSDALKILEYYSAVLIMCNTIIFKEKLNIGTKDPAKKKWKNAIRRILQNMLYLAKPNNGLLATFLLSNSNLNSVIINPTVSKLSNYNLIRLNLYKSIFEFLKKLFNFKNRFSCFLNEDIATFYIRFSYVHFVKIYSHSSNSELNEINTKITEIGNKIRAKAAAQEPINENIDKMGTEFEASEMKLNDELKTYQIILSKSYIKVLLAIAKNRTEEIKRKFYQYRILEFFTRETDLEFDINQIRERFLQKMNQTKKILEEEPEEETKDTLDIQITNLNDRNKPAEVRRVTGPLHRKKLSQNQLKKLDSLLTEGNISKPLYTEEFPASSPLGQDNYTNPFSRKQGMRFHTETDYPGHPMHIKSHDELFSPHNDEHSPVSDMQSTHAVFKKRGAIPGLNFHGSISSLTAGPGSAIPTPTKLNMDMKQTGDTNLRSGDVSPIMGQLAQFGQAEFHNGNNHSIVVVEPLYQEDEPEKNLEDSPGIKPFQSLKQASQYINQFQRQILEEAPLEEEQKNTINNNANFKHIDMNSPDQTPIEKNSDRSYEDDEDGESQISMRELLQTDLHFRSPQNDQPKKAMIPARIFPLSIQKPVNLPSFLPVSGTHYGIDAQHANSPRDSKKGKVPSLKIGGMIRENIPKGQSQQPKEKPQEITADFDHKRFDPTQDQHHSQTFGPGELDINEILTENSMYYSERRLRKIYEDDELHALVVNLMISLLLNPGRGTFDDHYISQYPILDGKQNILYILHFHLNHPGNQHILPLLLEKSIEINPFPAGQRLLKLLCISLSDMSIYTEKKKIGGGAYGTVYECNTNLADPQTLAIKETKFPSGISERCTLYDIFTEITCLEHFRLEPSITDIYDYGVTENSYIIVMKKYPCSLRDWRQKQDPNWQDNLPTYLTIYRDILKSVAMLHADNITHYDLKCDNILLDYKTNSESEIRVTLGDFGTCKMFTDEEDEFCMKPIGTEAIRPPEMLNLNRNMNNLDDNYDRRRKIGTTRASDIWSLGCLLYEILTGDFLYEEWYRLLTPSEPLLREENFKMLGHNVYIKDFMTYILVRDPQHRPSIDNVLKRFEHIHAILVSNPTFMGPGSLTLGLGPSLPINASLEGTLDSYIQLLFPSQAPIPERVALPNKLRHPPTYLKIMEEVSICTKSYYLNHFEKLLYGGFTHIVVPANLFEERHLQRFRYLILDSFDMASIHTIPYIITPRIMDYFREVFLYRGRILFIEDDNVNLNSKPEKLILRAALLFSLTHFFKCSVYETWTLINSQVLFYWLPFSHLSIMSNLMVQYNKLNQFNQAYPKIQCICGCATVILKPVYRVEKHINMKPCSCSRDSKTIEFSDCPSDGCAEYMRYVKDKFKLPWENIKWGYFGSKDFLIGPPGTGTLTDELQIKIILNSEGVKENTVLYAKKLQRSAFSSINPNKEKWSVYQCKVCHMWLFAENKAEQIYAVIMNNVIKKTQNGIMVPHSQMGYKIKTPILRNFRLSELR